MTNAARNRYILRAALGYALLAGAWILASDRLLFALSDLASAAALSLIKGLTFVLVTTGFLVWLLHRTPDRCNDRRWIAGSASTAAGYWPPLVAYPFALAVTGATLVLRAQLALGFNDHPMLILLLFPVILSALLGGMGPGLVAITVAGLGALALWLPAGGILAMPGHELLHWGLLVAAGVLVSLLSGALHRAVREARAGSGVLSATLDGMAEGVIVTDREGRVLFLNPTAEALTRWARGEALGRPAAEVFCPSDGSPPPTFTEAPALAEPFRLAPDTELTDRDGGERPISGSLAPVVLDDDTRLGAVLVFRDETARRAAEGRLDLLGKALGAAADTIVLTDRNDRIEWANPAFSALTGYPLDEVLGCNPRELLHSGVQDEAFYLGLWETILSGEVWRGELVNRRKDGALYTEYLTITPVRDDRGEIGHFVAIGRDITERQRMEAALEAERTHLRTLVNTIPDLIWLKDPSGVYLACNPMFERFVGRREAEILGLSDYDLVDQALADLFREHDRLAIEAGRPSTNEEWVTFASDGRRVLLETIKTPMADAHGRLAGVLGVARDVTGPRQAEEALRQARQALEAQQDHLEEEVAQRTQELQAARADAERLAQVRSAFLAHMSHEIRNPLNGVLGFAEIGGRDAAGTALAPIFRQILDSGRVLLGIVNDILDLSKIEAGGLTLERTPFELGALMERALALVAGPAQAKGIALRLDLAPELPAVCLGDPLRLTQIVTNLLGNAVKFTGRGEVTLAARQTDGGLTLDISDTGIGMDADTLGRLFTPFQQGADDIARRYGGTGLGLTITAHLVGLMGGTLSVESRPGAGSRFQVSLPLVASADGTLISSGGAPGGAPGAAPDLATSAGRPLAGLSVLVAEDDEVNRMLIGDMLDGDGVHLTFAENGRLAVELVRQAPGGFDLLLTDIQMPELDGYATAQAVREIAPRLPVVGLTAHVLPEERARCLAAGMLHHLAKPFSREALVGVIRRYAAPRGAAPNGEGGAEGAAPVANAPNVPEGIDWVELDARHGVRPGFQLRLLETVLAHNAEVPGRLRAAAEAGDYARLADLAHGVKGLGANLRAESLRRQAAEAEVAARLGQPEAPGLVRGVIDALVAVLAEVAERRDGLAREGRDGDAGRAR